MEFTIIINDQCVRLQYHPTTILSITCLGQTCDDLCCGWPSWSGCLQAHYGMCKMLGVNLYI